MTKVSIILPTYNGEKFISQSLDSVISQSYKDWELLVIDDGSKDNTSKIVNNYSRKEERIKYIKNEKNLGIQKTLNKGLKLAKGGYIARIDDDDIWSDKDKLKKQVEFLDKNKEYVLVGTGTIVVDENRKELYRFLPPEKDKDIRNKMLYKNCFTHSSIMFKKDSALKFGGYSENKESRHIEDYDLWLKLGTVGKMYNISDYSTKFTAHSNSISSKNKLIQLRRNIKIIRGYRDNYPKYCSSVVKNYFKFVGYLIFKILPSQGIRSLLLRGYKNN